MSSAYSANQYDGAFRSHRLQNWCEPRRFTERPAAQEGHTTFIADDRGHLLPGLVKGGSAWPDFKGTWDLPARIPVRHLNPTGRSEEGLRRLRSWGLDPQHTGRSQTHKRSTSSDTGEQSENGASPPASATKARAASQNRHITGGSKKQDCETAESPRLDGRPTKASERAAVRSAASERAAVRSAASERAAVRSAASERSAVRSEVSSFRESSWEVRGQQLQREQLGGQRSAASERAAGRSEVSSFREISWEVRGQQLQREQLGGQRSAASERAAVRSEVSSFRESSCEVRGQQQRREQLGGQRSAAEERSAVRAGMSIKV